VGTILETQKRQTAKKDSTSRRSNDASYEMMNRQSRVAVVEWPVVDAS
jgi:hypothetical protein